MREDSGQRIAWIPVEGHIRPDPGPVLVGAEDDWCVIVSPMAGTIVSIHPRRDEIYGRRGENPSVVLRLPDGHHVDPTMVWCGEDGEIRVRFSKSLDLRWQLPDRPASTIRDYDKVRHDHRGSMGRQRTRGLQRPESNHRPRVRSRGAALWPAFHGCVAALHPRWLPARRAPRGRPFFVLRCVPQRWGERVRHRLSDRYRSDRCGISG